MEAGTDESKYDDDPITVDDMEAMDATLISDDEEEEDQGHETSGSEDPVENEWPTNENDEDNTPREFDLDGQSRHHSRVRRNCHTSS